MVKFIIIILILLVYFGPNVLAYFGQYKSETLICNIQEKRCEVERVTRANRVERQFLVDPYEVKDLQVARQSYQKKTGIRMRRHTFSYYELKFVKSDDRYSVIFHRGFSSQQEAEAKADEIRAAFRSGSNIIKISR